MLADAREKKYAIPAFDISNYEMMKAVLETCEEEKSPALLMGLGVDLQGRNMSLLTSMVKSASDYFNIPVCFHLDHTKWLASKELQDGYLVNEYFHNHPEMVLGTFKEEIGMYGAKDLTVIPDGRDLKTALMEAIEKLPANFYTNPEYSLEEAGKVEVDYAFEINRI